MKKDSDENAINNKRNQEEYEEIKINNENDEKESSVKKNKYEEHYENNVKDLLEKKINAKTIIMLTEKE